MITVIKLKLQFRHIVQVYNEGFIPWFTVKKYSNLILIENTKTVLKKAFLTIQYTVQFYWVIFCFSKNKKNNFFLLVRYREMKGLPNSSVYLILPPFPVGKKRHYRPGSGFSAAGYLHFSLNSFQLLIPDIIKTNLEKYTGKYLETDKRGVSGATNINCQQKIT